jgi:hypothetical protein
VKAQVDLGIQVAERLRNGVNPLPVHASHGVEGTGLVVSARFVGKDELRGHRDQLLALVFDVLLVLLVGLLD